jgi:hypothetical protein
VRLLLAAPLSIREQHNDLRAVLRSACPESLGRSFSNLPARNGIEISENAAITWMDFSLTACEAERLVHPRSHR